MSSRNQKDITTVESTLNVAECFYFQRLLIHNKITAAHLACGIALKATFGLKLVQTRLV